MVLEDILPAVRNGGKAARSGWNGDGMFIFLVNGSTFQVNRAPLNIIYAEGTVIDYNPHIDICMPDGSIGVWTCTQGDLIADDWVMIG